MEKNIRESGEKNNQKKDIKQVFKENFKKQIKVYIETINSETGKKIEEKDVKKSLESYLNSHYQSHDIKAISNWYIGKNIPKPDVLVDIANFFNCTIDELLMDKNTYEEKNRQMREKGFSEEAIKKIELLLRKPPKKTALFGEIIESEFGSFEFLNDLICNQNINELIRYFSQISKEFFNLTKDDMEKINTIIPDLKESNNHINNIKLLKDLLLELPEPVKYNVQKIKDNIDLFIELHTAIYILKLYKESMHRKII